MSTNPDEDYIDENNEEIPEDQVPDFEPDEAIED